MLTDMIEGEFDMKEEEPWYDHQDLEHDLHLAAELGKNLLEQNRDLEKTLQQMYISNQEQMQEIEYLSKQVELLRSVNDQQNKVYEQLDASAQELELENHRLLQENRTAHVRIEGLSEAVDGLQTQTEELQRQIQTMKLESEDPEEPTQTLSCCRGNCWKHNSAPLEGRCCVTQVECDEHQELLRSLQSLKTQLSSERAHREAAEQEVAALEQEISRLEPKASLLCVYEERLAELEQEVQELRLQRQHQPELLFDEEVGVAGLRGRGDGEHQGVSLLKEVDDQYAALQEKYDTLLRRCSDTHTLTHTRSHSLNVQDRQPEYKALFQEIFSFIEKSKQNLKENSKKPGQVEGTFAVEGIFT